MSEHPIPGSSDPSDSLRNVDCMTTGTRKRKIGFALKDPNNSELQRTADQAARKKTNISETTSKPKGMKNTAPKKSQPTKAPTVAQKKASISHRASVESVDDEEDHTPQRIFPRNPATIIESDKDDDVLVTSKSKRGAETRNEVEDEEMEKPAESEEAEVGEYVEHFFTYYIITLLQSAFGMSGKLPSMPFSNQRPQSSTLMADECMRCK